MKIWINFVEWYPVLVIQEPPSGLKEKYILETDEATVERWEKIKEDFLSAQEEMRKLRYANNLYGDEGT